MNPSSLLLPSCYLAPVSYYALIMAFEQVRFEQHEYYIKQSYRNRCSIYASHGRMSLVVPLESRSSKSIMKDLRLSYAESWQKLHWKSFESSYGSSPFFEFYRDDLEPLFQKKTNFLIDWNLALHELIMQWLELEKDIPFTDHFDVEVPGLDQRPGKKNEFLSPDDYPSYIQVFSDKGPFVPNLSIVDLIFNEGPASRLFLKKLGDKIEF